MCNLETFWTSVFSRPVLGRNCVHCSYNGNTAKSNSLVIVVKPLTNKNALNIWDPDQSINQDTYTDVYLVVLKDVKKFQ